MRGTLSAEIWRTYVIGLIPTYAGNTISGLKEKVSGRAHPHVCGEHLYARLGDGSEMGSSPRMRGTPVAVAPAT